MLNRRPKRIKYLKSHKGKFSYNLPLINPENKNNLIQSNKGNCELKYSLISCEPTRLTAAHIYAGELAIKRSLKIALEKGIKGQLIIPVFPHIPVTQKPAEVRMGKGKGSVDYWMTRIKIGTIIFEIKFHNIPLNNKGVLNRCFNIAKAALTIAQSKLPIKTIITV
jgi:large subunit ribosomal protein L16